MAGGARVLRPPGPCERPRGDLTGALGLLIGGRWSVKRDLVWYCSEEEEVTVRPFLNVGVRST
ncbi:uncharacterized protein N7473_008280 [Penicillium subrubescens]|uniref:uncharacterized protein n=1 Tax=Penicillium subrubescens TaxID=1316194 RepID=UPI0025453A6D|nr:uncharacterized protein N7473_008280 [Penicillium subrubescens]KAJ5892052.1 hypothetical protein N7473_008280 [Penicillium subrubescens]